MVTSYDPLKWGTGGLALNMPFNNLHNKGWLPTLTLSNCGWEDEIADRNVLSERYCKPNSNRCERNSSTFPRDAERGLMCLPTHQPHHLDQTELYAACVLDLQECWSNSVTLSENPCVEKACLRQAMQLRASDSPGCGFRSGLRSRSCSMGSRIKFLTNILNTWEYHTGC